MGESDRPVVVFDCVTFVQAAMNPSGAAGACLRFVEDGTVRLVLSDDTFGSIQDVLSRPEIRRKRQRLTDDVVGDYLARVSRLAGDRVSAPAIFSYARDPNDEPYLNLAIVVNASYLVSHDNDLLDLMKEDNADGRALRALAPTLRIVNPPAFLFAIRSRKDNSSSSQTPPNSTTEP